MLRRFQEERVTIKSEDMVFSASASRRSHTHSKDALHSADPMAFVILPNGDIRPRDECPPGLALPALPPPPVPVFQQPSKRKAKERQNHSGEAKQSRLHITHLKHSPVGSEPRFPSSSSAYSSPVASSSSCLSSEEECKENDASPAFLRHKATARSDEYVSPSSSSSSSSSPQSSSSAASSVSNNQQEVDSERHDRYSLYSKAEAAVRVHGHIHATSPRIPLPSPSSSSSVSRSSLAVKERLSNRRPPINTTKTDTIKNNAKPTKAGRNPAILKSQEAFRPPPLSIPSIPGADQLDPRAETPTEALIRRQRQMEKQQKEDKALNQRKDTKQDDDKSLIKTIERLEQELQKEKKRVLEKMTLLLEEQAKTERLQERIDMYEAKLQAKETELNEHIAINAKQSEENAKAVETKWAASCKALEEIVQTKEAAVMRLEQEKQDLQTRITSLQNHLEQDSASEQQEQVLKRQLEEMCRSMTRFQFQTDQWKHQAKELMGCCDQTANSHTALVDSIWSDFPAFPSFSFGFATAPSDATPCTNQLTGQSHMVSLLKKRLRLVEDDLHQTKSKYAELKELCARQCVREADLQNFINEHRLRGNLVIRKETNDDKEQSPRKTQGHGLMERMTRGTNTSTSRRYDVDPSSDDFDDDDDAASSQAGDDEDDEDEEAFLLRRPKVYVQVGRMDATGRITNEPSRSSAKKQEGAATKKDKAPKRIERIRLLPSSTLAHRIERVPDPESRPRRRRTVPTSNSRSTIKTTSTTKQPPVKSTKRSSATTRSSSRASSTLVRPWV